jgi:hypothetical protein
MKRSTLIEQQALTGDDITDRIGGIPVPAKIAGTAGDDVSVDSGVFLKPPENERVIFALGNIVRDDHEEIPIAPRTRIAPRAAAKQPNLKWVVLFLDSQSLQSPTPGIAPAGRAARGAASLVIGKDVSTLRVT